MTVICKVCGKSFKEKGLATHVIFRHWMTIREYREKNPHIYETLNNLSDHHAKMIKLAYEFDKLIILQNKENKRQEFANMILSK